MPHACEFVNASRARMRVYFERPDGLDGRSLPLVTPIDAAAPDRLWAVNGGVMHELTPTERAAATCVWINSFAARPLPRVRRLLGTPRPLRVHSSELHGGGAWAVVGEFFGTERVVAHGVALESSAAPRVYTLHAPPSALAAASLPLLVHRNLHAVGTTTTRA